VAHISRSSSETLVVEAAELLGAMECFRSKYGVFQVTDWCFMKTEKKGVDLKMAAYISRLSVGKGSALEDFKRAPAQLFDIVGIGRETQAA